MLVRIAQGLNHMGKGTMTLNALHSDRQLMCPTSAAALFAVCLMLADDDDSESLSQHDLIAVSLTFLIFRHSAHR